MNEKQEIMKKTNRKKNSLSLTMAYLFFAVFVIVTSNCKKDDTPPDCGCNSEIRTTIPESAELTGKLFYKNNSNDDIYNNHKYWIIYVEQNFFHSMIICNENLLSNIENIPELLNVHDIPNTSSEFENGINVKFSGHLKNICNPIFHPANYTYENLTITNIQQQ